MTIKKMISYLRKKFHHHIILRQLVKFGIVGGTATLINFVILYLLTEFASIWYLYSSIAAFLISASFNFLASKHWTFRNKQKGLHVMNQTIKFVVVMIFGLGFNTLIIYVLYELANQHYMVAALFAVPIVSIWSFLCNRLWTFKPEALNPEAPIFDLELDKRP